MGGIPINAAAPVRIWNADALEVRGYASSRDLAMAAARAAQEHLAETLKGGDRAAVIFATGNSQIEFLDSLARLGGVDWSKVTLFHMDEYLGIPADHSASFRRFLRERVEVRLNPRAFHYLEGDTHDLARECDRYAGLLQAQPIDLCCLGIGENGHLAFNDPAVADFHDRVPVKLVELDEACRRQQVGEGHFPTLEAVPSQALTLTIPTLCSARKMICVVPERRKAEAVRAALKGPVSTRCPASFLRRQGHATLFLDADSASLV